MLIDLQLHSTYSDGYMSPSQIAEFICDQGVKVAALSDHNTVSGLGEFFNACKRHNIKAISGMEIYAKLHNYRFNLLWYNFDFHDPELHNVLRDSQVRRRKSMRNVLTKLKDNGFEIEIEKVLDKYNHYIPLNHMVDEIITSKKNYKKIIRELKADKPSEIKIINNYFHNKDIYRLTNAYIDMDDIVELKKKIGGQLILCHPAKYNFMRRSFLEDLLEVKIDGIEKLSPHHSYAAVIHIQKLAKRYNLIETGGSDFHRLESNSKFINHAWQYFSIDSSNLRRIKDIIGKNG